jgi:hypothetical protein
MVLQDPYLHYKSPQNRALAPIDLPLCILLIVFVFVLLNRSDVGKIDVYPSSRLLEAHFRKLLHIMPAHAREKLDFRGSVRLVGLEVKVDADEGDRDQLEEVEGEEVRLWTIGLPVLAQVWATQGGDT